MIESETRALEIRRGFDRLRGIYFPFGQLSLPLAACVVLDPAASRCLSRILDVGYYLLVDIIALVMTHGLVR